MMLLVLFSLTGCLPEEDCVTTDEVIDYRTKETEFYTITEPEYKVVCE